MTITISGSGIRAVCLLAGLMMLPPALASEADSLTSMLNDFLAASHKATAHESFWADDLVYTSSNGTRFGKAEILSGFSAADSAESPPAVVYSARDLDVRIYGSAAVVAFRLVGTPADGTDALEYFNTGTFLKREGGWQVVAWQATSIPRLPPAAE